MINLSRMKGLGAAGRDVGQYGAPAIVDLQKIIAENSSAIESGNARLAQVLSEPRPTRGRSTGGEPGTTMDQQKAAVRARRAAGAERQAAYSRGRAAPMGLMSSGK